LTSLRLPPRSAAIRWVVYGGLVLALGAVLAHVLLASGPGSALLIAVVAAVLNLVAWAGVFLLVLVSGSCSSSSAHFAPLSWVGAVVIYLGGAAAGLRARWHAAWAVPISLLLGGAWLVLVSNVLTGSTGACID
jgi:hypothetical protein